MCELRTIGLLTSPTRKTKTFFVSSLPRQSIVTNIFAVAVRRGLNHRRSVLLDLCPKTIKPTSITGSKPILKSCEPRTQRPFINVSRFPGL